MKNRPILNGNPLIAGYFLLPEFSKLITKTILSADSSSQILQKEFLITSAYSYFIRLDKNIIRIKRVNPGDIDNIRLVHPKKLSTGELLVDIL